MSIVENWDQSEEYIDCKKNEQLNVLIPAKNSYYHRYYNQRLLQELSDFHPIYMIVNLL